MLTEQELKSAVFAVEQHIKDIEHGRERDKHNASALHETSQKVLELKIKHQVLHYAEGIVSMITKEELSHRIQELTTLVAKLSTPRDPNLFGDDTPKKTKRNSLLLK